MTDRVTIAVCTYNRAGNLVRLIRALREQESDLPLEILVVNNNSTDETEEVVTAFFETAGPPVRLVNENRQGIVPARNRAIAESLESRYLAFIDDDELPGRTWIRAAVDALAGEGAQCAGGRIDVRLPAGSRPRWLEDELLYFLGKVDNGPEPFWITDRTTPVWSGNVAYRTSVFRDGLRFDRRYDRKGRGVGGGSDDILFRELLARGARIRYRPDMIIEHLVDPWRLKRLYFLELHYKAGWKAGRWGERAADRSVCGVPLFLVRHAYRQLVKTIPPFLFLRKGSTRLAMNSAHAVGMIVGRYRSWNELSKGGAL